MRLTSNFAPEIIKKFPKMKVHKCLFLLKTLFLLISRNNEVKEQKKCLPMPQRTDLFHSTILCSNDLEDIHLSTIKILI